ncbi:cobalt ECF transporter T component CbiQ [Quadrisphaera sp. DSM 44207]|uniref:cobalt ECF transporter T component CbiQ n=1 Tax=Quadrisphaera sp. DSM 44207 TaxID=1881057 RepID=UPI00088084E0|nr:cobalt ECF transporter T component CbiQ [Quadrisphaera sp. DSM 44207]SDQ07318.1 cobalt/nickel transport system permease protein [Quadrisphaera sp. DSM 44207]
MSAGVDGLLVVRDSPVHRLPAHVKTLALVLFALAVVATPAGAWAAFAAQAALLLLAVLLARVPLPVLGRRLVVEAPFAVSALLLPLVATGPRTQVAGVALSQPGLLGAGTLLAKATLGTGAAVLLASTTAPRDLLAGLERLRLPAPLLSVMAFMLRYAAVVADDLRRVRIAREVRGAPASRARHLAAVAAGVGAVFVRTYERGERVQQAMLARGWRGGAVAPEGVRARAPQWLAAAALPAAAAVVAALAAGAGPLAGSAA